MVVMDGVYPCFLKEREKEVTRLPIKPLPEFTGNTGFGNGGRRKKLVAKKRV